VSVPQVPTSPVPPEVGAELERVAQRWRQLPLDRALSYAGRVRALVQSLADEVAAAKGLPATAVPDCGPATLMDQLRVMVYDVILHDPELYGAKSTAKSVATDPPRSARSSWLTQELADLRRALH
jgi:hypothetical protein